MTQSVSSRSHLGRLPALDGVRACCIVLIVSFHYFYSILDPIHRSGLVGVLHKATALNWIAMDLFFVLSGFLIGRILISTRGADNYFRVFFWRRACRIFPAYFLVLVIFFIALKLSGEQSIPWLFSNPVPLWTYPTFLQNFWMTDGFGANWPGVTWSLALEEQFYLIFAVVVFLMAQRWLLIFLLAGIVIAPFVRFFLAGDNYAGYVLLPARMDALMIGALIAWMVNHKVSALWFKRYSVGLLVAAVGCCILILLSRFVLREGLGGTFSHVGMALLGGLVVNWGVHSEPAGRLFKWMSGGLARWLAGISYMLYLIHQPVLGLAHGLIRNQPPILSNAVDVWVTVLALVLALALSTLSYFTFEQWFLAKGRYLNYRMSAETPSVR